MEVILQENYPSLGYVGDRVKVRPGYARNYLLPRGIALEVNSGNAKLLSHRMSLVAAKKAKLKAQALEEAKKFEGLILEFNLKIGERGKSFGSVSARDVEASLKDKGFELDRRQINLPEQIKSGGDFEVFIVLHSEVTTKVTARVTVERLEVKADKEAKPRKGRRKSQDVSEDETGDDAQKETSAAEDKE